ncbi:hypothetical protein D3879_01895 [Pseudomonas cavernicola]|uniref:Uncharacterized protein n=1 Tax=Pseudomonas cavernicola TaxID=2320866 RepID=A0A418XI22_9PSED|nr:hypothetical protein [Pseudomonas cavernicola]RJG12100.1 hypothetical protein D3879_01895 [Pseudomonas cavernicola]
MQYSTALSDGILALACLAGALWIYRARAPFPEAERSTWFCALLGFALPASAALCGVLRYGLDPSWQEAHARLSQASSLLGLPLLGIAALTLARGWAWPRIVWCWVLIGLSLLFEAAQRLSLLDDYRLLLNLVTLLLLLYVGALQLPQRATPLLAAAAAVSLLLFAGLLVGTEGFIGPLRRVDLFHALLSLAYPLFAWLLLALPGGSRSHALLTEKPEKPVKTL